MISNFKCVLYRKVQLNDRGVIPRVYEIIKPYMYTDLNRLTPDSWHFLKMCIVSRITSN